ncbi:MAG: FKBP-type peptidyl-prolyl cis-trans isomerase [Bacteroidia bacterium]
MKTCNLVILALLLCACQNTDSTQTVQQSNPTNVSVHDPKFKNELLTANARVLKKEQDEFAVYAREHKMPFIKTPRGVWVYVYVKNIKGMQVSAGMTINMSYTLSLLNGDICETSAGRVVPFQVSAQQAESGLHYGLMLLKKGEKAVFLLPSSRAQGLMGDQNKIPPQSPLVYTVELET